VTPERIRQIEAKALRKLLLPSRSRKLRELFIPELAFEYRDIERMILHTRAWLIQLSAAGSV
jgi:hypothetical protein